MAKKERDAKSEPMDEKAALAEAKPAKATPEGDQHDYSYTQNREVSWLRFDDRVLEESYDESVPLYERLKFVSIFQSNLDEWFMIRIGGLSDLASLKHEPVDNKSHETPSQQLAVVMKRLPPLLRREERALETIEADLATKGLARVRPADLTETDLSMLKKYFDKTISPIISPLIVDPRHPFPNLRNGVLYCVCSLDGPEEKNVLGLIEVPPMLTRVIELPSSPESFRYILVEDVILSRLDGCFGSYVPKNAAVIRVTRNADIDPDGEGVEEEEDYRQHMKKVLKKRLRLQPVRLEINGDLDARLLGFVQEELLLTDNRIFQMRIPLDLSYVFALEDRMPENRRGELTFTPFEPQPSAMVAADRPMREQIEAHDVLLFYPYESMGPLLDLIREASVDDECISIKITLYRVARQSRLCESLIAAAENGKDVTVLMELRARFDEENNIEWAERLDNAGCTVIYGSEGFKCHSKICQITYHDRANISRITCLGTGNFNEKTARLYSDFMLMTAHEGIAEDGNRFFRNLSLGNLRGTYQYLGVAPVGLKPLVMRGLDREIARARAGEPAQVFFKMNSLTDRDVIDKLAEACQAGVNVLLIIRGICCIKADVPNKTAGLNVHQIVGRLLEHARVYAFGADVDTIYLSSADMMTRNTERRVEICYPVLDPVCRDLVLQYMNLQLADNVKARRLTAEGTWVRFPVGEGRPLVDSQDTLIRLAYDRAQAAVRGSSSPLATVEQVMSQINPVLHMAPDEAAAARKATEQVTPAGFAKQSRPIPAAIEEVAEAESDAESTPGCDPEPSSQEADEALPVSAPVPAPEPEPTPTPAASPVPQQTPPKAPVARQRQGRLATALSLIGAGFRTLFGGSPDPRGDGR